MVFAEEMLKPVRFDYGRAVLSVVAAVAAIVCTSFSFTLRSSHIKRAPKRIINTQRKLFFSLAIHESQFEKLLRTNTD